MPKKSMDENIDDKFEETEEEKIEFPNEPIFNSEEKEEIIEKIVESEPAPKKTSFRILRVDWGGFYGVDDKGNGMEIPIPKEYKDKKLKAGDIIYI
jgi:hypothetical protein